jgi:hypothetical protein
MTAGSGWLVMLQYISDDIRPSPGDTIDWVKDASSPVFYFVIPPSVSPIVIFIMYHLVPTPELFKELSLAQKIYSLLGVKGTNLRTQELNV